MTEHNSPQQRGMRGMQRLQELRQQGKAHSYQAALDCCTVQSLPPGKNEKNSLSLYFMPARLAFPGIRTQQEWHLMITQHMHRTYKHLTCMKNSTSDRQSGGAIL